MNSLTITSSPSRLYFLVFTILAFFSFNTPCLSCDPPPQPVPEGYGEHFNISWPSWQLDLYNYMYEIGEVGFEPGTGAATVAKTTFQFVLSDFDELESGLEYEIYVRAICQNGDTTLFSAPSRFFKPPGCGDYFYDPGGSTDGYDIGVYEYLFCPDDIGDITLIDFEEIDIDSCCASLTVFPGGLPVTIPLDGSLPSSIQSNRSDGCIEMVFEVTDSQTVSSSGWVAKLGCTACSLFFSSPPNVTIRQVLSDSVIFRWVGIGDELLWEITPADSLPNAGHSVAGGTIATDGNSLGIETIGGLEPSHRYELFARFTCEQDTSPYNLSTIFMTPPTCGGHYYDPGGPDDNHGVANNPPHTIICPDEAWQIASLTFEQVELANAVTLQIFDGLPPVSNASLLQTLFGNNIPTAPINSTSPDGCLTAFFSQGSFEPPPPLAGWKATMECFDCRPVHSFEQVVGFSDSLYAKWDALEKAVGYDWEIGLRGFTPNAGEELLSGSIGAVNELMVGGLPSNTYLELYLTANCDTLGISSATPNLFYTAPKCGDIFYDSGLSSDIYGNNESFITTICPDEPDQVLTLDFGFVNTQTCCDMIRIYRLFPSQALAWLATLNGSLSAKSISSGVPGECLVFEFESNDETAGLGWECAVNCAGPNSTDFAPAAQSSLALFPNPAEETVMLLFESPATSTAKVSLYAPTGQVVQQKELDLKAGANEQSLDIEHFAPGVYFVVVESETEVSVERLVVN